MNRSPINETVRSILSQIAKNEAVLQMPETASLKDDIGLDSMSSLMFLVTVEQELGFTIDPSTLDATDFDTIQSICRYIELQRGVACA